MRKNLFLPVSILLVILFASCSTAASKPETPHGLVDTWTDIALVPDLNGCKAMQGMAVVDGIAYCVKIKSDEMHSVLFKTDLSSGVTTVLKTFDENGKLTSDAGSRFGHGNDLCAVVIDGKVNLFAPTLSTEPDAIDIVRVVVNDDGTYRFVGEYKVDDSIVRLSGLTILGFDGSEITFLGKLGKTFYVGKLDKAKIAGLIEFDKVASYSSKTVQFEGQFVDLSSCLNQGVHYKDGMLYVTVCTEDYSETYIYVIPFRYEEGKMTTLYPLPNRTIHMVETNPLGKNFEVEAVSYDPETETMYFSTNRTENAVTRDGIHSLHYPLP